MITECDAFLDIIDILKKYFAETGPEKNSCFSTATFIKSYRDDLMTSISIQGGALESKTVEWRETEQAFDSSIVSAIIKNLRHKEPEKFFEDAAKVFETEVRKI